MPIPIKSPRNDPNPALKEALDQQYPLISLEQLHLRDGNSGWDYVL